MTKLANFWAKLIDNVIQLLTTVCQLATVFLVKVSRPYLIASLQSMQKICLGTDETSMFKGTSKIRQLSPVSSKLFETLCHSW